MAQIPTEERKSPENDKYNIDDYSYPYDILSSPEYGGHYISFNIDVSVDSKLVRENGEQFIAEEDVPVRERGDLLENRNNRTRERLLASNLTTSALAALGVGSILGVGSGGGALTGGILGSAGALTYLKSSNVNREVRRLKSTIYMHVPTQIVTGYTADWSTEETFALQAIGAGVDTAVKAYNDFNNNNTDDEESAESGPSKFLKNLSGSSTGDALTNLALKNGPFNSGTSAVTGLAANPKKEQVFRGIGFREFTFDYQFFPKSAEEANQIRNIIKIFKYHMLPEYKDTNRFLYVYPSEFVIQYFTNNKPNPHLPRYTNCVLTNVLVNYTPNSSYSAFTDGSVTQTNLTLQFKELGLITKEKINKGY